jgi:hypothetical protein
MLETYKENMGKPTMKHVNSIVDRNFTPRARKNSAKFGEQDQQEGEVVVTEEEELAIEMMQDLDHVEITNATDLYHYYRDQYTENITDKITKDL